MKFRKEVLPFIGVAVIFGLIVSVVCFLFSASVKTVGVAGLAAAGLLAAYFLYFFRDPDRTPPTDPNVVVAGADGTIMHIKEVREDKYLKAEAVRISIFLSLFDVHVNRAPLGGMSTFLGYVAGKHFFTFEEKSSEFNQHNAILIEGATKCLVYQIVGPVARRVVYWHDHDKAVPLKMGQDFGMMKFGSRMDMYFPKSDVAVLCKVGDIVRAGETVIARLNQRKAS